MAKAADDRRALAMATVRGRDGVASLALYPGLVRTQGVMQFADHLNLNDPQSPEGSGVLSPGWSMIRPHPSPVAGGQLQELARRYDDNVTT